MMKSALTFVSMLFAAMGLFSSCEKDDDVAIKLNNDTLSLFDSTLKLQQISIGVNNDTMVFVDLTTGATSSSPVKVYDLAFEASPTGQFIYLNTGKYMFAYRTTHTDVLLADSTGLNWQTDGDTWEGDSTALGRNTSGSGVVNNHVIIIDRGKYDHTGGDRYRKLQIAEVDESHYLIRYCLLDNSGYNEYIVTKNDAYSLMYFSFSNNGQMVTVAPPKNLWDMVFTRYIHTYWDQPPLFRYYPVNGTMLNVWNDCSSAMLREDSLPGYKLFNDFTEEDVNNYPYTTVANQMGFDWKYFDFNINKYVVRENQYYIIRNGQNEYYKLQYIDFYNEQGQRGYPTYQYQRIN